MSQTSTNTQDSVTIEHSAEPRSARQEEQLRELCQDLNSADRDLALQDATPHAIGHFESQLVTRELLLDELIEQLGIWEKEIAGRRQAQQAEAQRLETKQEKLDQLAVELAQQREQLHKDQIKAERIKAAAEARLETFSQIEKSRNLTGPNQEGHRDPARVPKNNAAETKQPAPASSRQPVSDHQRENPSRSSAKGSPAAPSPPKDRKKVPKQSPSPQPGPLKESRTSAAQNDLKSDSNSGETASIPATSNLSTARFLKQFSQDTEDSPSQKAPVSPATKSHTSAPPKEAEGSSEARPKSEHKASEPQNEAVEVNPSIQEYMNTLLGRGKQDQQKPTPSVRSTSPTSPQEEKKSSPPQSEPKHTPQEKEMSPLVSEVKKTGSHPVSTPALSLHKTVDKAEISARIRELRDVVNESAGQDVHHHSLELLTEWAQLVGIAVAATFFVGGVMYWFSQPIVLLIVDTAVMWFSGFLIPMAVAVAVGVGGLFLWGKRVSTQSGVGRNDRSKPAESASEASDAKNTEPNPR